MGSSTSGGRRAVLVTRPLEEARQTAARLAEDGIEALVWPLTAIRPVATTLAVPPTAEALLLTSGHGARAFAALSTRRDLPALCVGQRTAEIARGVGLAAMAAGGDAEALVRMAVGTGLRHFFHPRGRHTATDLPALLAASGQRVSEAVVYAAEETGACPAPVTHALGSGRIGAVGLWSARNAEILARRIVEGLRLGPGVTAVAISERAAAPLGDAGFSQVVVADEPSGPAMVAALARAV